MIFLKCISGHISPCLKCLRDSQALNMIYTALGDLVTLLSLILSPVTTFALALWYITQFSKHNRAAFSLHP